jgi:hypothetical protein
MTDFSQFEALQVPSDVTANYTFDDLPGAPMITLSPMTDDNMDYLTERVRESVRRAEASALPVLAEDDEEGRIKRMVEALLADEERDRHLLAKCCIRSWTVTDAKGKEVPVSEPVALAFLKAIPLNEFRGFRNWSQNIANFRGRPVITAQQGEKLGN